MPKTSVTKRDENVGAVAVPSALADLFDAEQGAGTEDVTPADIQLPFIKQVQDISPERDNTSPEYIEGADSGDLFNSVTREVYPRDSGLECIPCNFRKVIVAWRPRSSGGGFAGEFATKQEAIDALDDPRQYELQETSNVAVMYRPLGSDRPFQPALLSLSKSKAKLARAWLTQLLAVRVENNGEMVQPPIYGTRFALNSVRAKNAKGSFYNLGVRFLGVVENADDLLEAKQFGTVMGQRDLRSGFDDTIGEEDGDDKPAF